MKRVEGHEFRIEQWSSDHRRTGELRFFIESHDQQRWYDLVAEWHQASYTLVASDDEQIVGFLRFVVQEIGHEFDRKPLMAGNTILTEGKVLAFAVDNGHRRRGVGSRLQLLALAQAKDLGCFQLRSFSSGSNLANHALKLKLGFAACPDPRESDPNGVCFVMPLAE